MMPAGLPRPKRMALAPREMSTRSVLYESIGMLVRKKSRVRSAPARPRTRVEFCGLCSVDSALAKPLPVLDAGEIALEPAGLGVGGVDEEVADIGRRRVDHELRRDHRDGGADIAQVRAQAGAGERGRGGVSTILGLLDDERRERHRLVRRGGSKAGGGRHGLADQGGR
jgi:hypothetical protein